MPDKPDNILKSCRGTSLLEVLIAAVVLAIGLLGISALQLTSLRGATSAKYRSLAATFSSGLAEKMRANKPGSKNYVTTAITADDVEYCNTVPPAICSMSDPERKLDELAVCTPAQMAGFDLWELRCNSGIRTLLPGGSLTVLTGGQNVYKISISWLERDYSVKNKTSSETLMMTVMLGGVSDVIQE